MPTVKVTLLEAGEEDVWDTFVHSSADGTFFHLSGWRSVIETAFGHRTFYLLARRESEIAGILPLTQIRSQIFGNSLISNAFCVYGGPVATDDEARQALTAEATRLAGELKVSYVEFRSTRPSDLDWTKRDGTYVTFRRAISANHDANMMAIPRKQRAMVRKGIANGLTSEIDRDSGRFYDIYARSVHLLGTPVFSRRYFEILKQKFGEKCDIITIMHDTRPVASVMNFYFRDQVIPYYGGGTPDARILAANSFMYWEVMHRAADRGFRIFDFGRSKVGTGSYDFKRNWGFEPIPITYEFLSINGREIPENNPLNPKFRMLVAIWRRLPLFVTKIAGPMIVRSIG